MGLDNDRRHPEKHSFSTRWYIEILQTKKYTGCFVMARATNRDQLKVTMSTKVNFNHFVQGHRKSEQQN